MYYKYAAILIVCGSQRNECCEETKLILFQFVKYCIGDRWKDAKIDQKYWVERAILCSFSFINVGYDGLCEICLLNLNSSQVQIRKQFFFYTCLREFSYVILNFSVSHCVVYTFKNACRHVCTQSYSTLTAAQTLAKLQAVNEGRYTASVDVTCVCAPGTMGDVGAIQFEIRPVFNKKQPDRMNS